jgi:hypothetical protein
MSASSRGSAFRLMSRNSQVWGRRAASVIKPSGGAGQRAPAASQAAPKLQNEFGLKSGKTRRIFVGVNVSFAPLSGTAHIELNRAHKPRDDGIGATETRTPHFGRWGDADLAATGQRCRSKSAKLYEGGTQ